MITLSEITNSLGVTILKTSFSSSLIISVFASINISNLLTHFEDFSDFAQPYSTGAKGAKDTDWDIMLMQSSSSNGKGVKGTNRDACVKNAFVKGVCAKSTYTGVASTVKHSGIHL